jgi:hypothetical protein|tara:strand:- start:8706 stop:9296 length:591 start_codon:yes stop_codon:yes gene_type:complete
MKNLIRMFVTSTFLTMSIIFSYAASNDWVTLIDGTEGMENFNIVGDANWHTDAASVRATEGSGASWLVTKESFSDFVIRVEFWASHDANSGIYMRCANPDRITDRDCYEANIFDQRPDASFGTGGIVHVAPVDEPRPTAGDKWNTYKITMNGDHLVVELNGKVTADVRDSKLSAGPIGLQWGRGELRFRKVEIMEL